MSEIKNGRLGLYGAEHSKCNHMMTLGFKGLSNLSSAASNDEWWGVKWTWFCVQSLQRCTTLQYYHCCCCCCCCLGTTETMCDKMRWIIHDCMFFTCVYVRCVVRCPQNDVTLWCLTTLHTITNGQKHWHIGLYTGQLHFAPVIGTRPAAFFVYSTLHTSPDVGNSIH